MGHAGVIGIVVQARIGSTRLPGKVLRDMGGRPMLSHTLARLQMVQRADRLIVAIPDNPDNDELALYCRSEQVECFRGSEDDVLARYYDCAYHYGLAHIVRATADCPLVDPEEVDALIALHLERGADYSSSKDEVRCGLPNGTGSEVFTFTALERSHRQGNEPHHREHINEYIVEHPELFRICAYREPPGKSAPQLDLTVDTAEDFALVQGIVEHFGRDHQALTTQEIIAYCETRVPR